MKHKLLNKLWLRVGMIVAIMTTALAETAWADVVTFDAIVDVTENVSMYSTTEKTFTASDGSIWKAKGYGTTQYDNITIGKGGANYLETPLVNGNITSVSVTWRGNVSYYLALQTTTGTELGAKKNPSATDYTTETFTVNGSFSQLRLVGRRSSGTNNAAASITKVVVTYTPASEASPLASIAVDVSGATTVFHVGDTFTHEGATVTATYEDASTKDVTADATFSTPDMTSAGNKTVTVSYTENEVEKTTSYDIEVKAPATLESISLSGTYPTEFTQGDAFSSEGIVVTANYDDESTKDVTGDATFSGYDMSTTGEQTVTVSYEGKTATYTISVNEYVQPTQFDIALNDAFFGTNYGGTAAGITDETPVSGTLNNVTVTYAGSGNHYINNNQTRFYPNNKLTFEAPEGYNITQIVFTSAGTWAATITPDDGTYTSDTKTWEGEAATVLFTGSGSSRCDMSKVTITLEAITPKVLSSIALSGEYPTTFHVGDAFSHEGMIVTATYESGKTADVTASATFTGYDMATAGEQTVTVSYTEGEVTKTATYTITVNAPATLTSITLSGTYPTEFEQGDAFSSEGIVVTANYDDDTTSDVTTEATFSGYDMATLGEQTVTVSYGGKTVTYSIIVVEKKGTEDNPYTVAQARAAINASSGTQGVYATGIVTEIVTPWGQNNYQNITFNFVDAEGDTDFLQAFRCVSGTGVDASTVAVGDVVVVYGNLTKYGSTYEFAQGCTLVSLTHPAVAVEAPTFTPVAGTYAEAQSVTISCETEGATIYYTTDGTEPVAGSNIYNTGSVVSVSTTTTIKAIAVKGSDESSVATATYFICSADDPYTVTDALAFPEYPANEVYVTGIVSTAPTAAPSSGALTYYISVDGEATNQLEVYKGKGLNQAAFEAQDDIQVGDIVTIYGNVVIYGTTNPIKEFASGNYLVSFERPDTPVENPTLTIANPANVTITATYGDSEILVNGDDATVESGTEITLFVTLATDYNLETLTVTGEGGQNVELTQSGESWTFTMPEYSVTVNATASAIIDPATSHTYELVTDASTLAADDVIIIAYNSAEVHKAMGEQRTNNRASVDVTQSGTQIIAGNTVQQITLEGDADGWYFNVGDGYLYAASSSSNWLRTQSEEDDNAKATIEISSENYATITFQGTNTRNLLQYNNNNDIFSCYSSGQKAVQIYRLVETPTPETEEIKITSLKYSTYASDNALDFTESGIKAFYATLDEDGSTLTFHQIDVVPAGTGVLLYSPSAITKDIPVFTGTPEEITENVFVRGTGEPVSYTETDYNYILFNGDNGIGFYKAKNNPVATNRAYIHIDSNSPVKYFTIDLDDDPTGIDNLNDNLNSNGAIYNLAGQRLQKMQKGINIINGKKVLK